MNSAAPALRRKKERVPPALYGTEETRGTTQIAPKRRSASLTRKTRCARRTELGDGCLLARTPAIPSQRLRNLFPKAGISLLRLFQRLFPSSPLDILKIRSLYPHFFSLSTAISHRTEARRRGFFRHSGPPALRTPPAAGRFRLQFPGTQGRRWGRRPCPPQKRP